MKIGIHGSGWRKQMTEDMLVRAGVLAEIKDGLVEELTLVCSVEPGDGQRIEDFVKEGGNAIVLYPERELLGLFGEELMYTHSFPMLKSLREELPFSFLQVFQPISLIRPSKCEVWAKFALNFTYSNEKRTSRYPAIAWREVGKGRLGMFFYDLPSSILLLQQGREFFASDGDFPMPVAEQVTRASSLSYGLVNSALQHLPQAYFHELLLLSLSRKLAEKHSPIPRVWAYPFPHTTALLMSGDSDGLGRAKLREAWQKFVDWGSEYTQMITLYDLKQVAGKELAEWRKRGIDFAFHYYAGAQPTQANMRADFAEAHKLFLKKKVELKACRGHSIIWVGWDEQVKIMEEAGIEISSNLLDYYHWGASQGLPYPLYTDKGRSSVHELQLFATDDPTFYDKSGSPAITPYEALLKLTGVLDTMNNLHYQPLNCLFHPCFLVKVKPDTSEWAGGIVQHAQKNDIPVMNLKRFFEWWTKRGEFLSVCAGNLKADRKALARFGDVGVALPEHWKGRGINAKGKRLRGTGEVLLPLKDAANAKYK